MGGGVNDFSRDSPFGHAFQITFLGDHAQNEQWGDMVNCPTLIHVSVMNCFTRCASAFRHVDGELVVEEGHAGHTKPPGSRSSSGGSSDVIVPYSQAGCPFRRAGHSTNSRVKHGVVQLVSEIIDLLHFCLFNSVQVIRLYKSRLCVCTWEITANRVQLH